MSINVFAPDQGDYVYLPTFGDAVKGTGVCVNDVSDQTVLQAAKDAGFSFIRVGLDWGASDVPWGLDTSKIDGLIPMLNAVGLGALILLRGDNPMYSPGSGPKTAAQIRYFGKWAAKIALQFRGNGFKYEIWNEPDTKWGWGDTPSVFTYRKLYDECLKSIKRVDPHAQVGTGGVTEANPKFIRDMCTLCGLFPDGTTSVGVHPYRQDAPETVFNTYAIVHDNMTPNASIPPLWCTEWGYPSVGYGYTAGLGDGHSAAARARQAKFVPRCLLSNWIAGIELMSVYDMKDDGTDPNEMEHNFGLLDAANVKLPAYSTVQTLFNFVKHAEDVFVLHDKVARAMVLRLITGNDEKLVVWCYGDGNAASFDFSDMRSNVMGKMYSQSAVDLFGATKAITANVLTVKEDDGPVLVTVSHT
ncbi:GH39 family glycosyl hydrolase [Burkholderia sp. TSV86]|uniref:GH39 family glycosyl hydrolase n=1 Tax=Burkholderia sp. TSV86 TaxID=1385594 RepID=UPI0007526977|nr:cellulase family glycosylhydrolase [Burkholderia sp. TSV86]KVE35263.1 hypothetical protein WS68_07645 [Burkholderia sp. TSV86]